MSDTSSIKDFWCSKKKITPIQKRALLRLLKDLRYVKDNPLPTVTAEPEMNDVFRWHGNIKGPNQSPLENGIFHFIIHFSQFYPQEPPTLEFLNSLPHPFVTGKSICLNMLDNTVQAKGYVGWSPQYTVYNILCQLQSFLIDGLEVYSQSTGYNISFTQKQTSQWKVVFENRDQEGEGTLSPYEIRELLLEVGERKPSSEELALYYNMQHIPKEQPIDFSTFLDILKRKREFRKVVESFNNFTCARCTHSPQNPNPKFIGLKENDFTQKLSIEKIYEIETECFFTKRSFKEPDFASLGVGISFLRNPRNGQIHKVFSSIDFVSLNSFRKANANKFHDNLNEFTHWLPVYLNDKHGEKAMHLLPRCLGIICSGSHRDFNPEMILDILPKIIGGEVSKMANGNSSNAVNALKYYCLFIHLFLVYLKKYPQVIKVIRSTIHNFINDPLSRNKDNIPSLSDFFTYFFVIESEEEEKKKSDPIDILKLYKIILEEINVRSVLWIVKKYPELDKNIPDEKIDIDRISNSFECSKAGFKILLFHKYIYNLIILRKNNSQTTLNENLIDDLNLKFGRPSESNIESIIKEYERISSLPSFDEVYMRLGLEIPEKKQLLNELHNAVTISTKFNYHCKRIITVQSADEYLKEKLQKFISLDDLIDESESKSLSNKLNKKVFVFISDEDRFKKLCDERFGATELPEIDSKLSPIKNQWQHLYIKLNLEDLLCKFNENPDFKRFYRVIELSAYTLRSLEFTIVPVTNIKSNFYYLTALLSNMWNLEKFIIKRGEFSLDLKGCKALCKGLKNNPNSLRVLDFKHCQITGDSLKIIENGLLSSKNLISLDMEGNPIGLYGAGSIAKVLRTHSEITYLNLCNCSLCGPSAEVLAEAFYYNQSLKIINLSKNRISEKGMALIFQKLAYSKTLEEIYFLNNEGEGPGVAPELTRLFEVSLSLKKINFYLTKVGRFFTADTFHGLSQNRSIIELDLGSTSLGSSNVSSLGWAIARNKNIKKLYLENSGLGANGLQQLSEAIYDTEDNINARARKKTYTDLSPSETCEELRPRGCELEIVNLSSNAFTISSIGQTKALERFISLTKSIIEIDLSKCNLGVPAGEALGKGLINHPTLLKLNLKGNILEEYGIKKLCKGLNENSILEYLDISRNNIGGRGASALGNLLSNNKCGLKTLNIYGNLIGIEGARFIADSLQNNSTLTDIDLGLNRMRPKGVHAIIQSISKNNSLKILRLKQNFINDKTAMELADVLVSQSSIDKLCIAGNKIKDSILSSIVSTLKNCKNPVSIDIATLMEVTQQSRLQNTVYCTPLPLDITSNALKKMFYDGGCGAIANVSILKHATRDTFSNACYAFIEFAEEDSALLALDIGAESKAKIGKYNFSVIQAQGQVAKNRSAKNKKGNTPSLRGGATRGRGSRGRGSRGGGSRGDSWGASSLISDWAN